MRSSARKSPLRHLVWILPLLALDFFIFRWLALRHGGCQLPVQESLPVAVESSEPPPPPPPIWQRLVTPTPQQNLYQLHLTVFGAFAARFQTEKRILRRILNLHQPHLCVLFDVECRAHQKVLFRFQRFILFPD